MSSGFHLIWNGVEIPMSDFKRGSLRDRIAFEIAHTAGVFCRDKEAAMELLRGEAEEIIGLVRSASKGGSDA